MFARKLIAIAGLATLPLAALPVAALAESEITGDAEAGERVFRKCQACHQVGADAQNRVGPTLNGIVDGPVGANADFAYSDVFQEMNAEGKTWTAAELDAYLTKPRDYAKGTKMAFAGLRKEDERADVIAYLATFGPEGGT